MMAADRRIGGYFGLETQAGVPLTWFDQALAVQSGRMALHLALPVVPATLWLPAYFCPPVIDALGKSGWAIRRYPLGEDFGPGESVQPGASDRVLLVDYFGLTAAALDCAIQRFGAERCIVDACMALFAEPHTGVPTAYSPRKFVGLPDGGLLLGPMPTVRLSSIDETASLQRCTHLLKRAAGDVQGGRDDFAAAEASLESDLSPRIMSRLTRHWLGGIDFPQTAARRRSNATRLSAGLAALGFKGIVASGSAVPMCWPVPGLDPRVWRPRLAEHGIYCANYWPGLDLPTSDRIGRLLAEGCTCLPIDQRYGDADMDFIVQTIEDLRRKP